MGCIYRGSWSLEQPEERLTERLGDLKRNSTVGPTFCAWQRGGIDSPTSHGAGKGQVENLSWSKEWPSWPLTLVGPTRTKGGWFLIFLLKQGGGFEFLTFDIVRTLFPNHCLFW